MPKLALSIDFEEWFDGLISLKNHKKEFQKKFSRIENQTNVILQKFKENKINATFFIVGRVAEQFPYLVKQISDDGHEVALHSFNHDNINFFSKKEFEYDLQKNKYVVESIINKKVYGYRAPFFSIEYEKKWFLETLEKNDIKYDSSFHEGYNFFLNKSRKFSEINTNIKIFPIATYNFFKFNFIFTGGFYFRLLPISVIEGLINLKKNKYLIFYFHPWEFDHLQPKKIHELTYREKISHYYNLKGNNQKFKNFIKNKKFIRIIDLLDD